MVNTAYSIVKIIVKQVDFDQSYNNVPGRLEIAKRKKRFVAETLANFTLPKFLLTCFKQIRCHKPKLSLIRYLIYRI